MINLEFEMIVCSVCDVHFAVTRTLRDIRLKKKTHLCCPNGHIIFIQADPMDIAENLKKMEQRWKDIPTTERSCEK